MITDITYYRPKWTCGRYDEQTHSAIMFNLLSGYNFFFEDISADVVGLLLSFSKNCPISVDCVSEKTQIAKDALCPFLTELASVGLLTDKAYTRNKIDDYRNALSMHRDQENAGNRDIESYGLSASDAEIAYIKRVNRRSLVIMIELTYNCSESCIHCYNPGAARNNGEVCQRGLHSKLDLGQYKRLIDELYGEGTFKVCLTGGDPFSNPYAWEILQYLYEKEFAIEIFTNAQRLVGKENRLAEFFPCSVAVSIYSGDPNIHDSITKIKGSQEKSLSVLRNLHKLHIPLIVKCVLMQNNVRTYRGVIDIAKELEAEVQIDCRLFDSSDGDKCVSHNLRLTREQLRIVYRDPKGLYYVGEDAKNYGALKLNINEPACMAGNNNLCITPDGFVIPCCTFHAVLGDIKTQSFHSIVEKNRTLDNLLTLPVSMYEECGTHEYCDFCILCPGLNFGEHGTPTKAAENSCYYAKIRYELYQDLSNGDDPLQGKDIETVLEEIPYNNKPNLCRIPSISHLNTAINLDNS